MGGYFIGTVPDGKRVLLALNQRDRYEGEMLKLAARTFRTNPQPFGSAFSCSIGDTVTEGHGQSQGSFEYLVYKSVFTQVAQLYGLQPLTDYADPSLDEMFEPEDQQQFFKHFNPHWVKGRGLETPDGSLEQASRLNVAFAFQKLAPGQKVAPPAPAGQRRGRTFGTNAHGGLQHGSGVPAHSPAQLTGGLDDQGIKRKADNGHGEMPQEGGGQAKAEPTQVRPKIRKRVVPAASENS